MEDPDNGDGREQEEMAKLFPNSSFFLKDDKSKMIQYAWSLNDWECQANPYSNAKNRY